MFDFVGKKRWFLLGSAIVILAGLISLFLPGGLKLGIEFEGGIAVTLGPVTIEDVKQKLVDLDYGDARVEASEDGDFSILIPELNETEQEDLRNNLSEIGEVKEFSPVSEGTSIAFCPKGKNLTLDQVKQKLTDLGHSEAAKRVQVLEGYGFFIRTRELSDDERVDLKSGLEELGTVKEFESISSMVASETVRNAAIAVGVAAVAILLYITWAFRRMPSPFRYGTCAIIALIHDVLIVLGIFSFLGRILNWEIDPMFITAVLAIIGYSVNDTIVVFDRLRENLPKGVTPDFGTMVNFSLTQTLGRSLNTSMTTILVVLALYFFVGGTLRNFILALSIGIVAGTYSSIFIASQLLVIWERGEWGRFLPRIPLPQRIRGRR